MERPRARTPVAVWNVRRRASPVNLPLDDRAVISRIVHGDGDALAALVNRHRPSVLRHLRRYPIEPQARDSIAHDVITDMVRKLATFTGETDFTTWLYRVTANTALHHMRARRVA